MCRLVLLFFLSNVLDGRILMIVMVLVLLRTTFIIWWGRLCRVRLRLGRRFVISVLLVRLILLVIVGMRIRVRRVGLWWVRLMRLLLVRILCGVVGGLVRLRCRR